MDETTKQVVIQCDLFSFKKSKLKILQLGTCFYFLFTFYLIDLGMPSNLISMYQVIPQEVVDAIYASCKSGNFDLTNKEVNNVIAEGYPVSQMLSQV